MVKRKKNAAVEGEEHGTAPDEETVVAQPAETTDAPEEAPDEEETTPDEVAPEEVNESLLGTTTIKYLLKGPIASADGGLIYQNQTGDVVSHLADAMVGRGHAEYIK